MSRAGAGVLAATALLLAGCAGLGAHAPTSASLATPATTGPTAAAEPARRGMVKRVRVPCVPSWLRPPPHYPDSDAALRAAAGAADRYQLMAAGRLLREKRLAELERIVEACRE